MHPPFETCRRNYDFGAVVAAPRPCVTSRSCVSLSRCTFLPFDVITEPSARFVAGRRLASFKPYTPRLSGVRRPKASRPFSGGAPFEVTVVSTGGPVGALDVAGDPPIEPVPPGRPMFEGTPGEAAGTPPPLLIFCCPGIDDGGGASATMATFKGSSSPPFKTALSNAMPKQESAPPLARAAASVTCPISFVPFGMMVFRLREYPLSCALSPRRPALSSWNQRRNSVRQQLANHLPTKRSPVDCPLTRRELESLNSMSARRLLLAFGTPRNRRKQTLPKL